MSIVILMAHYYRLSRKPSAEFVKHGKNKFINQPI